MMASPSSCSRFASKETGASSFRFLYCNTSCLATLNMPDGRVVQWGPDADESQHGRQDDDQVDTVVQQYVGGEQLHPLQTL